MVCLILVDGEFNQWSQWSVCLASCDEGRSVRTRTCANPRPSNGGKMCQGDKIELKKCNLGKCPGKCATLLFSIY